MSQPSPIGPIGAAAPDVRGAIAHAARSTGVDFGYLLAQARLESDLDPAARAGTSSAAGLYQFTRGTWLQTLDRHGTRHGLDWTSQAIDEGRVSDPGLRHQIMALRFDPQASALMAAELASDNADHLTGVLGRTPDAAELYMAHFLGAGGAGTFLRALTADPAQSAAVLLPQAAAANRAIFYSGDGTARSVGQVMDLMRGKMQRAMARDGADLAAGAATVGPAGGAGASPAFAARFGNAQPVGSLAQGSPVQALRDGRPSMAETLRQTFGLAADGGAAGERIRAAYGKLRAFDL